MRAHNGHVAGWMCALSGRGLLQRPVRPVLIAVIDLLAKDPAASAARR